MSDLRINRLARRGRFCALATVAIIAGVAAGCGRSDSPTGGDQRRKAECAGARLYDHRVKLTRLPGRKAESFYFEVTFTNPASVERLFLLRELSEPLVGVSVPAVVRVGAQEVLRLQTEQRAGLSELVFRHTPVYSVYASSLPFDANRPLEVAFPVPGESRIIQSPDGPAPRTTHVVELFNENALDIEGGFGQPVVAARAGKVVLVINDNPDMDCRPGPIGNHVFIVDADGYTHKYVHLRRGSIRLREGDVVRQGDYVGEIGVALEEPLSHHLHYEVETVVDNVLHSIPVVFSACGESGLVWRPRNGPVICASF